MSRASKLRFTRLGTPGATAPSNHFLPLGSKTATIVVW